LEVAHTATATPFTPVSRLELDTGLAYAQGRYDELLDIDLLGTIVDESLTSRTRRSKLPLLVATVVRRHIHARNSAAVARIDAYKGACMKILSDRSVRSRAAKQRLRDRGIPVPPAPEPVEHPEDPRRKGQLMLL